MKAGDIVQLVSGGITMTIGRIYTSTITTGEVQIAVCYWTAPGTRSIERMDIPLAALKNAKA